jgi:phosphatidylglycerophosphatase A
MTRLKLALGTLFGAGLLPKAPGTWGSLFTLPLVYLCWLASPTFGIALLVLVSVILSLWTAPAATSRYGDDPPEFVMDETAGQALTFLATSFAYSGSANFALLILGFLFFRLFDILKPLGINRLQKLPGKFGILVDDLLAGIYALACLEAIKVFGATLF